jgi:Na+-driven multidrug efflux pump
MMTIQSLSPDRLPRPVSVLRDMVGMALPLSLGVLAASGLQFGKIWLLSYHPDTGVLTTLSLLQPYQLLLLAFLETLAITNQVFSARSKKNWPRIGIRDSSRIILLAGSLIATLLIACAYGLQSLAVQPAEASVAPPPGIFAPQVLEILPLFILSILPFFLFEVYNAALRGQGRVKTGVFALILLVAVDLSLTYAAMTGFGWGFEAVLLGNVAGPLAAAPIVIIGAHRCSRGGDRPSLKETIARLQRLLVVIGLPIFLTMVAGFASAAVLFPAMANLGAETATAFLFIIRLRILFMVPAIAAGSAIAILSNQAQGTPAATSHLTISTPVMAAFYALATLLLIVGAPQLLDHVLPADATALRLSSTEILLYLGPTFFTTAVATMLQIILEQLERGLFVLLVTVFVEAMTCLSILAYLRVGDSLSDICFILIAFSILSLLLYSAQFLHLLRSASQWPKEARDAV